MLELIDATSASRIIGNWGSIFLGDYLINKDMIYDSGKLAVVDQMLKRLIKDGHRVSDRILTVVLSKEMIKIFFTRATFNFLGLNFQSNDNDARHFGRLSRSRGNQILSTGWSYES